MHSLVTFYTGLGLYILGALLFIGRIIENELYCNSGNILKFRGSK